MYKLFKNKKTQVLIPILLLIFAALIAGVVLVSSSDEDDESISNNEPTSSPVSPPAVISDAGNVEDDDTDQDSRTDEATSEEVVIPAFPSEDSVHPKQEETWKTYKDPLSGFEISYPSSRWEFTSSDPSQGRFLSGIKDSFAIIKNDEYIIEIVAERVDENYEAKSGRRINQQNIDEKNFFEVVINGSNYFMTNYKNASQKLLTDEYMFISLYESTGRENSFTKELIRNEFMIEIHFYIPFYYYIENGYQLDLDKYDEGIINEGIEILSTLSIL